MEPLREKLFRRFPILRPIGIAVGAVMAVVSPLLEAFGVPDQGLPVEAWVATGLAIFFLSVVAVVYRWGEDETSSFRVASSEPPQPVQGGTAADELLQFPMPTLADAVFVYSTNTANRLEDDVPCIDFSFHVSNGSGFRVTVDTVEGYIVYRDNPLGGRCRLIEGRRVEYPGRVHIRIRQWVSAEERAILLRDIEQNVPHRHFDTRNLNIIMVSHDPRRTNGRRFRLTLPSLGPLQPV